MNIRDKYQWALLVPTSIGVRITPAARQPVHCSRLFEMQSTSAETNVASIPASLQMPVKVLTAFVKDSPIATFIKNELRSRNFSFEGPEIEQGGPWGYRHQFNIADSGFGLRGPHVHNDRAGEVGRIMKTGDFDLSRIFGEEGVAMVHLSGLFAALSPQTGAFCLELARKARRHGSRICFDLNYRASFWKEREEPLRDLFTEIAGMADILVGNEEDFQLCLGVEGPETGGKNLESQIGQFKIMISKVKARFPEVSVFAATLREVIHANRHLWGAMMMSGAQWYVAEPREIAVLDRIGGGDGFVGGMIYGLIRGWEPERCLQFGWASGALATTFLTDYAQPADEEMIWSVWKGNARVKR